ncbi:ATP-binding protein [Serratia fonticola]|uniref:AAA family ATPase n=1 Tax=Serratia fonticola TaxID=47917 RepID=UPI00192BF05C|nr:AAA family ATPase [Serratia fonticola]MBL5863510.1 ATP-binding protein [Serratia fonticola]
MITIFTGDNGSGKSQKLLEISKDALNSGNNVIAIATTINDRFPRKKRNKPYFYMGSKLGRNVAKLAVKEALSQAGGDGDKILSTAFKILNYAGFEEQIGFKINGFEQYFDQLMSISPVEDDENERIKNLSSICFSIRYHMNNYGDDILWVSGYTLFNENMSGEVMLLALKNEQALIKYKLIRSIEIYLKKNNHFFPLNNASSGELSLISTSIFIAAKWSDNTVILIDEPENSLHPDWQRKYIPNLMDIFHYYNLNIFIATHSPLLISGCSEIPFVEVLKHNGIRFINVEPQIKNVEEAYIEQFDVITPENNALSERCIKILNSVSDGVINVTTARNKIDIFIEQSNDTKQKEFLEGVKILLKKIDG